MVMCNRLAAAAIAALVTTGSIAFAANDQPPYPSATEAYRQGVKALKAGRGVAALPALEYAAKHGVLGAQVKLARAYATGRNAPKDDAKAFAYFEQIADSQADISPLSPIAKRSRSRSRTPSKPIWFPEMSSPRSWSVMHTR